MTSDAAAVSHPAPLRRAVPPWTLMLGLALGPAAWIAQLAAGYGVSSLACFPHDAPRLISPPPGWPGEFALLLALNLAGLAVAIGGAVLSWRHWLRTRREHGGNAGRAIDVGEGRTRFLAACAMLLNLGFAAAILFDTAVVVSTPLCWSIAS